MSARSASAVFRPRAAWPRRIRWSHARGREPPCGTRTAASTSTSPAGSRCQNLGHNPEAVVGAVHEQVDRYLHQCFMVGMYEPYVEVCRRLDELWPGDAATEDRCSSTRAPRRSRTRSRSRAPRPGGPAVVVFDRAFHGRTLPDDGDDRRSSSTSRASGRSRRRSTARPAPYPYRGVSTEDALAGARAALQGGTSIPQIGRLRRARAGAGRGRLHPDAARVRRARCRSCCERHGILYVDDEVQSGCGRTGPVWAIEHYGVEPDLLVVGQDARRRPAARGASPARAELMDARRTRRLGGTVRRQPGLVRGRLRRARRSSPSQASASAPTQIGALLRDAARRDRRAAASRRRGARARPDARARARRAASADAGARRTTAAAREQGLLLLSCGLYGNVIRLLPPLTATDEELGARALDPGVPRLPPLPLPPEIDEFLRLPNPAVVASLRSDGSPHTVATWYPLGRRPRPPEHGREPSPAAVHATGSRACRRRRSARTEVVHRPTRACSAEVAEVREDGGLRDIPTGSRATTQASPSAQPGAAAVQRRQHSNAKLPGTRGARSGAWPSAVPD